MTQKEFTRIMTEFRLEVNETIHVLLDASMNVFNGFEPPEHLNAALQGWFNVRKKLNRNGIGVIVELSNPGKPVFMAFVLTGEEAQSIGQRVDPLPDIPDESSN